MATHECVSLIGNIHANTDNTKAAFTTKLARPLNIPGQWRVSIMDISYPYQWTTINRDLTYAVMFPMINCIPEYDHNSILSYKQPIGVGNSFVNTAKPDQLPQPQEKLFDDIKEINFIDNAARYELLTDTISENELTDPKSIIQQIANSIKTLYYRRFPDAGVTECDDVVTYNPNTRRVIFNNLVWSSYLIAAPTNASIISMFGYGARSVKIRASSERDIDILPVETENSAASIIRTRNPLPPIKKVNLQTLDNVFVYTDIIE